MIGNIHNTGNALKLIHEHDLNTLFEGDIRHTETLTTTTKKRQIRLFFEFVLLKYRLEYGGDQETQNKEVKK